MVILGGDPGKRDLSPSDIISGPEDQIIPVFGGASITSILSLTFLVSVGVVVFIIFRVMLLICYIALRLPLLKLLTFTTVERSHFFFAPMS